jgi:hypothetical protein
LEIVAVISPALLTLLSPNPDLFLTVAMPFQGTDETLVSGLQPWKPSTHELFIMLSLSLISFMIALDATIVVTSINVQDQYIGVFIPRQC